jgi:hypothetical protein
MISAQNPQQRSSGNDLRSTIYEIRFTIYEVGSLKEEV